MSPLYGDKCCSSLMLNLRQLVPKMIRLSLVFESEGQEFHDNVNGCLLRVAFLASMSETPGFAAGNSCA